MRIEEIKASDLKLSVKAIVDCAAGSDEHPYVWINRLETLDTHFDKTIWELVRLVLYYQRAEYPWLIKKPHTLGA